METRSDMQSRSGQFSVSISPTGFNTNYSWSLAYTYQNVSDRVSAASAAAARRAIRSTTSWGRSDFDSRHQIQYNVGDNFFDLVRVNWSGSFRSGTPFTPMVAGDINGDGYANDRAFVVQSAATADPSLAAAMQSLLSSSAPRVRNCLQSQLGQDGGAQQLRGPVDDVSEHDDLVQSDQSAHAAAGHAVVPALEPAGRAPI